MQDRERLTRERYLLVKNFGDGVFDSITAFAATFEIPGTVATDQSMLTVRAGVEKFCVSLVAKLLEKYDMREP